jgi:hypothetical protein
MKKLILASTLFVAVFMTAKLLSGPYTSQSFINGRAINVAQVASATALVINGNSTDNSYTNDLGQLVTNGTNASGVTFGSFGRYVTVRGNSLGDASANSIAITAPGTEGVSSSGTTNTVTVTFERSSDGTHFDTTATWVVVVPGNNNAASFPPTLVTNVPAWFVTGASHLRVANISFATNSFGYTNAITAIRFNTFAP